MSNLSKNKQKKTSWSHMCFPFWINLKYPITDPAMTHVCLMWRNPGGTHALMTPIQLEYIPGGAHICWLGWARTEVPRTVLNHSWTRNIRTILAEIKREKNNNNYEMLISWSNFQRFFAVCWIFNIMACRYKKQQKSFSKNVKLLCKDQNSGF